MQDASGSGIVASRSRCKHRDILVRSLAYDPVSYASCPLKRGFTMSKKFVLVTAILAAGFLMLSVGSMSAQVKVHKMGRPWEVDNSAVPYFDDSSPTGIPVLGDHIRWNSVCSNPAGAENRGSRFSPAEVRSSVLASPIRRGDTGEVFSFFYFLHV